MKTKILGSILAAVITLSSVAFAEETISQKADEAGKDTVKMAKKTVRTVKDKTCHLVKGKMECAVENVKHKVQNTGDEVKDKVDDMKK